jgi:uncharacterized C2H2 Zn-finger protein
MSPKTLYVCPYCGALYHRQVDRDEHMEEKHESRKRQR